MSKLSVVAVYGFLVTLLTGCGTFEVPMQPSRYQIENVDRNSGDQQDVRFPVDPSVRYDDESINPDIPQRNSP